MGTPLHQPLNTMATLPEPLVGPASGALHVDNAAGSRSPTTPHKRLRLDMAGAAAAAPVGAADSTGNAAADVNGKGKVKVEPVTPSRPEVQTPHQNDDLYGEPLSTHMFSVWGGGSSAPGMLNW